MQFKNIEFNVEKDFNFQTNSVVSVNFLFECVKYKF